MELQGIILPVGASNGCLCYCQQYFCSGWSKRVFPASKSLLVHGCNGSIEIRENLYVLQVKISAGEASSGAVLWFFTPCSARLKTKAYCVGWKLHWPMLENVVNWAQMLDFCKSISAVPNWSAVLCWNHLTYPGAKVECKQLNPDLSLAKLHLLCHLTYYEGTILALLLQKTRSLW